MSLAWVGRIARRFNVDNTRLGLKGLMALWVPVAVNFNLVSWTAEQATLIMGAGVGSVDIIFRIFQASRPEPAPAPEREAD